LNPHRLDDNHNPSALREPKKFNVLVKFSQVLDRALRVFREKLVAYSRAILKNRLIFRLYGRGARSAQSGNRRAKKREKREGRE
jgi:hypothetical protein